MALPDGRAGHAARRGNAIADFFGLARWTGLQQLQLRTAYMIGRQHAVAECTRSVRTARSAWLTADGAVIGTASRGARPRAASCRSRRGELREAERQRVVGSTRTAARSASRAGVSGRSPSHAISSP